MDRQRVVRGVRVLAVVGLVVFVAIQFVPYGRAHPNPPVTEQAPWPSERAETIAGQSCVNCHGNTTEWPWYANVAPMSWLVTNDVTDARDELNFSEWDRDAGEADDAVEAIREGTMPPLRYVLMHPSARLTDEERAILVDALRVMDAED